MSGQSPGAQGNIAIFEAADGTIRLDVRLERETVWLTQAQMAELFGRERSVVTKHIRNVFREGELEEATNVHFLHIASSDKPIAIYSLDVILSVGYRVNSKRGTQFRIWATRVLRDHVLRGWSLNEWRLREVGLRDLEQAMALLSGTLVTNAIVTEEGGAVLDVVRRYASSWRLLLEFDEDRLAVTPRHPVPPTPEVTLASARQVVATLRDDLNSRGQATSLFGLERGDQLAAALGAIEQTFDGRPLYPNAQSRAAHLLYLVIKDHPFADGNKRIGTLLFLDYPRRAGLLMLADGRPRLADNAVVALALLVAESRPAQKDLMVRLVLSLLENGETS